MILDVECSLSEMNISIIEQDFSEVSSQDLFSCNSNFELDYEPDFGELWDK